jgi:NaMN:DMB phosphoribosyltransferase
MPTVAAPTVAATASVPAPVEPPPPSPQVYAPAAAEPTTDEPSLPGGDALTAPTMSLPALSSGLVIQPGMHLPMPDEYEPPLARARLLTLEVDGAGFGALAGVVSFAAGTQSRTVPVPWRRPRAVLVVGDHAGGAEAGTLPGDSAHKADQARAGEGPLARLAGLARAELQVVDAPAAAAMEDGPALSPEAVESALRYGWRLAEEASDAGVDVLLLGACGSGSAAAAAAVVAATAGAEAAGLLGRVVIPGGEVDDDAWMSRLTAVRDALQRTRRAPRGAKDVLADLGGGDIAVATGLLLGAAARKLPVLLDGPVGVAAALVTRDLGGQARHWCLLADTGGHPTVRLAADVLGLTPMCNLRLDLGEGANALAALPVLVTALTLAAALPVHPTLAPDDDDAAGDDADDEAAGDEAAGDEATGDEAAGEDEDAHPGV